MLVALALELELVWEVAVLVLELVVLVRELAVLVQALAKIDRRNVHMTTCQRVAKRKCKSVGISRARLEVCHPLPQTPCQNVQTLEAQVRSAA